MAVCLTSLGLEYQEESLHSGLLVDLFMPAGNIVIEVDGPTHFARNAPWMLGSTAFKHRLLEAMGMKVVSINLEDWDRLMDLKSQRSFLEAAMARAGGVRGESP